MTLRKSRKILLLGELSTARVLGRSAEACGLEPVYHALRQDYPRLAKRDFASLREVLRIFAEESSTQGPANGSAHGTHAQGLVHPGTSPWGERVELLTYGQEMGLSVVAPSARLLSLFDHKLGFLMEVERLGLHHLSLSFDPFSSVREIQRFIKKNHQSFPFVLKSAVGGGQFGVYTVQGPLSLGQDFTLWLEQLRHNLGEVILFPEKYLESSRHLSVPFVRFNASQSGKSKIQIFPIVDGSLQSRFRKLVEICPPYRVDSEILEKVTRWTKHIAESLGYVGFGTIEFLVDGDRAFVIGGQTRLNTSFHLWEQVAGVSILEWQLAALGTEEFKWPLKGILPKAEWRHGLSVRICAEDSLFHLPQPGTVTEVTQQADPRIQMSYALGESLHPSDSAPSGILANVQVVDNHWNSARNQMLKVLDQLWIAGSLETNERMIHELLNHPWVREGIYHSGFVDEEFLPQVLPDPAFLELMAGVCSWHQRSKTPSTDTSVSSTDEDLSNRWMVGERWIKPSRSIGDPLWESAPRLWEVGALSGVSGVVTLPGQTELHRVCATHVESARHPRWLVRLGDWFMSVRMLPSKVPADQKTATQRRLAALVSGRVHAVLFRKGGWVGTHEPMIVLESLGVFVPHALPVDVRVLEWKVSHQEFVVQGQELALVEVHRQASSIKKSKSDFVS